MAVDEIGKQTIAMEQTFDSYETNPLVRFAFTLMEILPVGILISMLSAVYWAIIKKKV